MPKLCCQCIYWIDVLGGWCDYYSWPMDADDNEPCKAYEPIATSGNYVPVMVDELVELEERLRHGGLRVAEEAGGKSQGEEAQGSRGSI